MSPLHSAGRTAHRFVQVDVFSAEPFAGNPVAVVFDADDLTTEQMQRIAHWTNLSETTFVLAPTAPGADYRVRIFTPSTELPFAGHPTLGTAHAWCEVTGNRPPVVMQECTAGLITVRADADRYAFAAPPLLRSGPVDEADLDRIARDLRIDRTAILDSQWVDNGPGWVAVMVGSIDELLAIRPGVVSLDIGVVALAPPGVRPEIEVRAFFPNHGATVEDPVTGSLNASLADWLLDTGRLRAPYVASQGTALGRHGRVEVDETPAPSAGGRPQRWIGGVCTTRIDGTLSTSSG